MNLINLRREFFRVTPMDVKTHLAELAGELLQFEDVPEAVEHRQSQNLRVPLGNPWDGQCATAREVPTP